MNILSTSPEETRRWGAALGKKLRAGDVVLLTADLGAGKTTFVQGLAKAIGVKESAMSPTFIIAQTLRGRRALHHLDFYRLSKKEILDMGVEDYFTGGGLVGPGILVIEWADRFPELWPPDHVRIQIGIDARSNARRLKITGTGPRSKTVLRGLKAK
jgi:tRNA threonylcarbamoyladenosine biosynthesis protein TsaE